MQPPGFRIGIPLSQNLAYGIPEGYGPALVDARLQSITNHLRYQGIYWGFPLCPVVSAGGFRGLDAADGHHAHDAELLFHSLHEVGVLGVLGEESEEFPAGGGDGTALGERHGGKGLRKGFDIGQEPFEGDADVEADELAQAGRQFLVVHGGGVGDFRGVFFEPAFQTGIACDDAMVFPTLCLEHEGVVECGFEIGQAGADTEAGEEAAGGEFPEGGQLVRGGRAAQGRRRFGRRRGRGRGEVVVDAADEAGTGIGDEMHADGGSEYRQLGNEEGLAGGAGVGLGAEEGVGNGFKVGDGEGGGCVFHVDNDGGGRKEMQGFSLVS